MLGATEGAPRWRNLWRPTDPIASGVDGTQPAGELAVDERLLDPEAFELTDAGLYPELWGHAHYEQHPRFAAAVADLARMLSAGDQSAVGANPYPSPYR